MQLLISGHSPLIQAFVENYPWLAALIPFVASGVMLTGVLLVLGETWEALGTLLCVVGLFLATASLFILPYMLSVPATTPSLYADAPPAPLSFEAFRMTSNNPAIYNAHAVDLAEDFVEAIERYTGRLMLLSYRLDDVQRKAFDNNPEGVIVLRLTYCGPTCLGCPHTDWKLTRLRRNTRPGHPKAGELFVTERRISTPLKYRNARASRDVAEVIREIQNIIDKRKVLIRRGWLIRQSFAKSFPESLSDDLV